MKHRSTFLFAATAFLISGCTAKTPEPNQETTPVALEAPQKAAKALSASELLGQKLKNGMAYEDFRKIVLANGWLPLVTPECRENVGGEAKICYQQPEVEACSGDGHCNMFFANSDGSKLKVGTYGDLVKFFEFSAMPIDNAATSCPSQDFEAFLKSFASDKAMQKTFTTSLVRVEELVDDYDKGYSSRSIYLNKSDYKDFDLVAKEDGFHVLDSDDKASPTVTAIDIKPDGSEQYIVRFAYGMSEGNSYKFKKLKDCWYLTEDPEAPSP